MRARTNEGKEGGVDKDRRVRKFDVRKVRKPAIVRANDKPIVERATRDYTEIHSPLV